MLSFEEMQKILHSPFDLKIYKSKFIDYFEVCIDRTGTVHYAVPSHQEWLVQKLAKNLKRQGKKLLNFVHLKDTVIIWNGFFH